MATVQADQQVRTRLFIDGSPQEGAGELKVVEPAIPSSVVGYAAAASRQQAEDAVAAAKRAFPEWAARDAHERAELVMKSLEPLADFHDEDAEILTRENGKIRMESKIDLMVLNHRFELAAGLAGHVTETTTLEGGPYTTTVGYQPVGVTAIIVPFNWPLAILGASLPYALVAGNTVVMKPPPSAPLATARVVERIAAELPAGVLNLVTGEDQEIGSTLIQNPDVAKVCFTGSPTAGRRIMAMAAEGLTRLTLELGGNDPAVILDDAVLDDDTMGRLFAGIFDSTGQICMAAKRIYVHSSRYDDVVDGLSAHLGRTVLGHGLDEATTMGPLHASQQRSFVADLVEEARASDAEVREFGEMPDDERLKEGNFLRPSLVLSPDPGQRVVTEEQFGPTIPIIPFDDEQQAVAAANDTWAGLCSSVWTADEERARRVARKLVSGYVFVNNHGAPWLDERAPFGGMRGSGYGREMGVEGLREFMDTHSISLPTP